MTLLLFPSSTGTGASTLIERCRRFLGDWPEADSLTANSTVNASQLSVADSTLYAPGWTIQVGTEVFQVKGRSSATTLSVLPAARGTASTTHSLGDTILVNPRFNDQDYFEAINSAIRASFPLLYAAIVDETTVTTNATYEYPIPVDAAGDPFRALSDLSFKESGDLAFRKFNAWDVVRGSDPFIKLRRPLPIGVMRVYGFSPIPPIANLQSALDASFPVNAEDYLTLYACQYLTAAGEAMRVRQDTGPNDDREAANRPGSSLALSNALFQRALTRLQQVAMPPMPKHAIFPL